MQRTHRRRDCSHRSHLVPTSVPTCWQGKKQECSHVPTSKHGSLRGNNYSSTLYYLGGNGGNGGNNAGKVAAKVVPTFVPTFARGGNG